MTNSRVVFIELPIKIKAFTAKDEDDYYTIYLNSRLSREQNLRSYSHELSHIEHDDFYSDISTDKLELLRHND